jgi:NAD+ kinase
MRFKRILVVYKHSNYEQYILKDHSLKLKKNKALSLPLLQSHRAHYKSVEKVESVLKSLKINYDKLVRSNPFRETDYDLVITIGGDGTFLDSAQYLTEIPILGINSNPKESVGHFCSIRADEFYAFLHRKTFRVFPVSRLKVSIDKKIQRPVLNDVLITNMHPASTSRYVVKVGGKKEEQKSSGIWVSSSIGSTAAILGAGGRRLNKKGSQFQMKIREPYIQKGKKNQNGPDCFEPESKIEHHLRYARRSCVFGWHQTNVDVHFGKRSHRVG